MGSQTLRLRQHSTLRTLPSLTILTVLAASQIALPLAKAQEDGAPPPLLKGGIVHQLRSLSEGAKNAIDSGFSRTRTSERSRVAPPPRVGGRSVRGSASGSNQGVDRIAMRQPPTPPANPAERSIPHPSPTQQRQLAEVLRPEDLLGPAESTKTPRRTSEPSLRTRAARSQNQVHVEKEIPEEILRSIQSRTTTTQVERETEESYQPQKPRVSRIPLPGGKQAVPSESVASQRGSTKATQTTKVTTVQRGSSTSQADVPKVARRSPPSLPPSLPPAAPGNGSAISLDSSTGVATPNLNASTELPAIPSLEGPNPLTDSAALPAAPPAPEQVATSTQSTTATIQTESNSTELQSLPVNVPVETPSQQTAQLPKLPPATLPPAGPTPKATVPPAATTQLPAMPNQASESAVAKLPPAQPKQSVAPQQKADANALRHSGGSSNTRMSMVTPKIHVVLDGPADIPVGRAAEYRIIVSNEDTIQLQGLLLQMDIPAGVIVKPAKPTQGMVDLDKGEDGSTMISWTFDRLPGKKQAVAPILLTAAAPKNFPVAMEWTLLPLAELAHINVKAARLELALEGPSEVQFGKANTYRLHVRNPGNAPARNVEVALTAEQYGSSASTIGDIAAGGEETIDVELTFNQRGSIEIAAAAQAGSNLQADSKISVVVRKAELAASLASPQLVYHGTPAPVQLTVRNTGDATAENVLTAVRLPSGAKPVSLPPSARFENGEIRCNVGNIAAGDSSDLAFTVQFQNQGNNELTLVCSDAADNKVTGRSVTRVEAIADLVLLVSDPVAPAPVGAEVAYELKLTNRGSKAARNVRVVAQFSDGIEPLRGEGPAFKIVPGQLFFEPIPSVAAGETVVLRVLANASEGGMHRFRAEVKTDEEQMRLVQEEATQYLEQVSRTANLPSAGTIR